MQKNLQIKSYFLLNQVQAHTDKIILMYIFPNTADFIYVKMPIMNQALF